MSYVKFWGVRGSNPSFDNNKTKYGGDTSCVEVRTEDNLFILDMGTGIRALGNHIISDDSYPTTIHILLSHYHWDHVMGFLSFAPLFNSKYTINIYGNNANTDISKLSEILFKTDFWPVSEEMLAAKLNFITIENGMEINSTKLSYTLHGHPNGANSYRLEFDNKVVVYTTDCEHPSDSLNKNVIDISDNADVLIHDAHFLPEDLVAHKGWGHSTWEQAIDVAIESGVKHLILFHHAPEHNDTTIDKIELNAKNKFNNVNAAHQGLLINL